MPSLNATGNLFELSTLLDDDSLPAMTNLLKTRDYMEAPNAIVEEIMSNEGSSFA